MNDISKFSAIVKRHFSNERIESALIKTAGKVQGDIKSLAPVDTGTYRNSIQIGEVKHEGNIHSIEIYSDLNSGWKNVPLGYLLEWGTGINGEISNTYDHGLPYRHTPWVYYNERYGRWIFTYGNIARPHFYPGLNMNKSYFEETIKKEISKK